MKLDTQMKCNEQSINSYPIFSTSEYEKRVIFAIFIKHLPEIKYSITKIDSYMKSNEYIKLIMEK